jgi:hypothetical protein
MPNAQYYREQASLLMKLSMTANDHDVADRLLQRAREMAFLAQRADASRQAPSDSDRSQC